MKTNAQTSSGSVRSDSEALQEARWMQRTAADEEREPESEREIRPWEVGPVWGFSQIFLDHE